MIKINRLVGENENEVMVSILDTTHEILCNQEKAHSELLTMINATVSHELRNPLNAIVAFNDQKEHLYNKLEKIINSEALNPNEKITKTNEILIKLREGKNIQQSSTKLM